MKKLFFLLVAFCPSVFSSTNTNGWDVCETAVEKLDVAGEVSFSSSFSRCIFGDIICVQITPADPGVVVDGVEAVQATPHWQISQSPAEQLAVHSYNYLSTSVKRKCLYGNVIPVESVLVQKP